MGNAAPHGRRGIEAIGKTATAHHIATLLKIGVGIKQIVRHTLQALTKLSPTHLPAIGFRIRDGRLIEKPLHGDDLARQHRAAPAKAR